MCERYTSKHVHHCRQPHWKHPLQRFDRGGPFIWPVAAFTPGRCGPVSPCPSPRGGIVTHHVSYREESFARSRLELLCGVSARNASNDAIGNRTIQRRFDSLDAVYRAGLGPGEQPARRRAHVLACTPRRGPTPRAHAAGTSTDELEAAKEKWRADYSPAAG